MRETASFRFDLKPWLPVAIVIASGLIAWGAFQSDVRALDTRVVRLERRDEEATQQDRAVIQRLATIEAKLEGLRELLTGSGGRSGRP